MEIEHWWRYFFAKDFGPSDESDDVIILIDDVINESLCGDIVATEGTTEGIDIIFASFLTCSLHWSIRIVCTHARQYSSCSSEWWQSVFVYMYNMMCHVSLIVFIHIEQVSHSDSYQLVKHHLKVKHWMYISSDVRLVFHGYKQFSLVIVVATFCHLAFRIVNIPACMQNAMHHWAESVHHRQIGIKSIDGGHITTQWWRWDILRVWYWLNTLIYSPNEPSLESLINWLSD